MDYEERFKDVLSYSESEIKTLEGFYDWRNELEIEDWDGLKEHIEHRRLWLAVNPLGVFLESARFDLDEKIGDMVEEAFRDEGDHNYKDYERIRARRVLTERDIERLNSRIVVDLEESYAFKTLRFGLNAPACFLQGMNSEDLVDFVKSWHDAQPDKKRWNPAYVRKKVPERLKDLCGHNPKYVIENLNIPLFSGSLIYPVDGWTLAECLRISYESKKK